MILHQSTCNCYRPTNCTCVAARSLLVPAHATGDDVAANAAAAARESCCLASSDNLLACMVTVREVLLLMLLMYLLLPSILKMSDNAETQLR